jgi:hypothetical protein
MVTVFAFAVLAGGTAIAAQQLGKNSVGKKQLKANAVTTAKIKKAAVTKAKIKDGAVDGAKVQDGSLAAANLNLADLPFSRIVHKAQGSATVAIGTTPAIFPLDGASYTQEAGRDDLYSGSLEITFQPGCEQPRDADAYLAIDAPDPVEASGNEIVGFGSTEDDAGGTVTKVLRLGGGEVAGARLQQATAVNHTLSLVVEADCKTGSGATATKALVDVIGVK